MGTSNPSLRRETSEMPSLRNLTDSSKLAPESGRVPKLSIQISTMGEDSTLDVLRSIRNQNFSDFEIVVSCPERNTHTCKSIISLADKFVPISNEWGLLRARFEALLASNGAFSLMLDATRLVLPNGLIEASHLADRYDVAILREGSIGDGFWAHAAGVDRKICQNPKNLAQSVQVGSGFVLPRLFKSDLLRSAFLTVRDDLGPRAFNRVIQYDHHLVSRAFRTLSTNLGVSENAIIAHIEDSNLRSILRKYYRYGRSTSALREYSRKSGNIGVRSHFRNLKGVSMGDLAYIAALNSVKGSAYILGKISASYSD